MANNSKNYRNKGREGCTVCMDCLAIYTHPHLVSVAISVSTVQ